MGRAVGPVSRRRLFKEEPMRWKRAMRQALLVCALLFAGNAGAQAGEAGGRPGRAGPDHSGDGRRPHGLSAGRPRRLERPASAREGDPGRAAGRGRRGAGADGHRAALPQRPLRCAEHRCGVDVGVRGRGLDQARERRAVPAEALPASRGGHRHLPWAALRGPLCDQCGAALLPQGRARPGGCAAAAHLGRVGAPGEDGRAQVRAGRLRGPVPAVRGADRQCRRGGSVGRMARCSRARARG